MNKKLLIGTLTAILVLGGGMALAYAKGFLAPERQAHPPCNELPKVGEVQQALDQNKAVTTKITALGKDIEVTIGRPCKDVPDAALVEVRYGNKDERLSIDEFVNNNDTYGVPMITTKR